MTVRSETPARWLRRLAAVMTTLVMTVSIGWLARAPYDPPGSDAATLRLSWRSSAGSEETCRPRTQLELDALAAHMRTPEVCERESVAFLLVVQINDEAPDSAHVQPGGMKGDRPLYVMQDITLEPGQHRVRLQFGPTTRLDTLLQMESGAIALVTLHDDGDRFVVRR